jgi:hypothetical protein
VTLFDPDEDGDFDVAILVLHRSPPPGFTRGEVQIFRNDGAGSFEAWSAAVFGSQPRETLAAGDLNGDGRVDLAVPIVIGDLERSTYFILSLLHDGDLEVPHFAIGEEYFLLPGNPRFIAVGDFNGDVPPRIDVAATIDSGRAGGDGLGVVLNRTMRDANESAIPDECEFQRGDTDETGDRNITDAIYLLNYLFLGGPEPPCLEAADVDDDGDLVITDAIYLLNYLFLGGMGPPNPGCWDEGDQAPFLGCQQYSFCW